MTLTAEQRLHTILALSELRNRHPKQQLEPHLDKRKTDRRRPEPPKPMDRCCLCGMRSNGAYCRAHKWAAE